MRYSHTRNRKREEQARAAGEVIKINVACVFLVSGHNEKIAILRLQTLTTREFVTPQVRTSSCRSERERESGCYFGHALRDRL